MVDKLYGIVLVHFDIEAIQASKHFEKQSLAFHHRLRCHRPDISQAKYGGTV